MAEGIEIYFPFFFEKTSTFTEIFNQYDYIKYHDLNNSINKYNHLIENRYEDESHDSSRPLIKPSDLFLNCEDVMNFTESIKKIDANEIDYSFESFKKVEEAIQKHEFTDKKICLLYTSPSPRDVRSSRMPSSA